MSTNKMDSNYIFLVFFTVLCQSAAGFFVLREIMLYSSSNFLNIKHLKIMTLIIPGLLVLTAIITTSFHLGKPLQAVHTLRNLKSSWLSREIIFLIIFSGIILIYLIIELFTEAGSFRIPFSVAGTIAAAGLIICMAGIYMLKTVPVWNTFLTPAAFVITSALAAMSLMLVIIPAVNGRDSVIITILILTLIVSLIISAVFYFSGKPSSVFLFIIRLITGLMAIFVPVMIYSGTIPNKIPARLFLLLFLFITEITGRCIFYLSFYKSGL